VAPADPVPASRYVVKGGVRFADTRPMSGHTWLTLPAALAYSSNTATIALADRLGAQLLYEYQRAFGLGEPTGIGLPGEASGLVQPPANWSASSHGSVPIGFGVSATPLQMAAVYAAIANGGVWVRPYLVKSIISPSGVAQPAAQPTGRRVISATSAAALRTMLEAVVVIPGATGNLAAVPGYRVAGKTGTGKLVRDGVYDRGEVASFIGMAPADAPRYVIAVFAHHRGAGGGRVVSATFADLMQLTLRHYRVAPTGTKPPKFRLFP
jgi:cell division protein FtsI (penicillin-binding protein 3)